MNEIRTHIVCIVDRSGSMQPIAGDAIGGFNSFLESQQKASRRSSGLACAFRSRIPAGVQRKSLSRKHRGSMITATYRGEQPRCSTPSGELSTT
jgi:hypothetical protein